MEYEQQQPDNQDDNFMNRIKESPRTVSAIIIVVIVAAAIYAFSGNNQNTLIEETPEATPITGPSEDGAMTSPAASPVMEKVQGATTPMPVDKKMLADNAKKLPEARTTDSAYVEVAQRGDGLTHLARRAATRYLADHETGYSVTNEHRIYIEDYIRKHMEKGPVALGAEKTISFDLVKQAIESAQKLNARQLNNLTKYTSALR